MAKSKKNFYVREVFDPKQPIFVKKAFKGSGRNWLPGQHLDWKKLSMDQRRVFLMFEQRLLTHQDPEFTEADEEQDKRIEKENQDDLHTEQSGSDDDLDFTEDDEDGQGEDGEATESGEDQEDQGGTQTQQFTAVLKGQGWYNVVNAAGDVQNEKGLRKAEAEKLALDLSNK